MAKLPNAKLPSVKPPTMKPPSAPKPPKVPDAPKGPGAPKGPDAPKVDAKKPKTKADPPKPKTKMTAAQKAGAATAVAGGLAGTLYLLDAEKKAGKKVKECVGKCLPLNWDQFVGYGDGDAVPYAELEYRPAEGEEEEEDQPYCSEGIP